MIDNEISPEELEKFLSGTNQSRLRYQWMLRFKGYSVDEQSIMSLEKEVYPDLDGSTSSNVVPLHQRDLDELQLWLAIQDPPSNQGAFVTKAVLYRLQHTALKMRKESNHGRPHFHIEYKNEHSASYAIDTLEKLAGYVPPKYEMPLLKWATSHQASLLLTWNQLQAGANVVKLISTEDGP